MIPTLERELGKISIPKNAVLIDDEPDEKILYASIGRTYRLRQDRERLERYFEIEFAENGWTRCNIIYSTDNTVLTVWFRKAGYTAGLRGIGIRFGIREQARRIKTP